MLNIPAPKSMIKFAAHVAIAPITVISLVALAASQRWSTWRRQRRGDRPRLFWGPQPIIVIRDWSKALRSRGYESHTFVNNYFAIHGSSDYDRCRKDLYWPTGRADSLKAYPALAEALVSYDIFHFFFDGGLLGDTPLWRLEPWLLKLAGKKIVVSAYGADIAVPGYLGPIEEAMIADYPWVVTRAPLVRRKVDHYTNKADLVIATLQPGYLPCYDFLWVNQFAVDTKESAPNVEAMNSPSGDTSASVVVIHAPNHRTLKGTTALVDAMDRLQQQGVPCELHIVERECNEVLRSKVLQADIVVDQLLLGFGYFALESLSVGKPVVSNVGWMPSSMKATPSMLSCPIIDANRETIGEVLRQLLEDPDLRRTAGNAGRDWIVDYHSLEAVGAIWEGVFRHVWEGTPLPDTAPRRPAGDALVARGNSC